MRIIRLLLLTLLMLATPAISFAQFSMSIAFAPPALPVYEQPVAPDDGYLWTPGYWAYGDEGYFWVPGTWVMAPEVGLLWTPGYWGWAGDGYAWNDGYWGTQVGFYGGVNYGFGYGGVGYEGGYWDHDRFNYNRSVNNLSGSNVHYIYNKTVNITTYNYVSYNGGSGGISARPTQSEDRAAHEQHRPPVAVQTQHVQAARHNHELLASVNQGRPTVAATAKPAELSGHGVVAAKQAGAPYKAVANHAPAPAEAKKFITKSENSTVRTESPSAPAIRSKLPSSSTSTEKGSVAHDQPTFSQESATQVQSHGQNTNRPAPFAREQPAIRQESAPRSQAQPQSTPPSVTAAHEQRAAREESAPRQKTRAQSDPHSEEKEEPARYK